MEYRQDATICNQMGLHARAATKLVELAAKFEADVVLSLGNKKANANSVLGLLLLESSKGKTVTVIGNGVDAKHAVNAICQLISSRFEEK